MSVVQVARLRATAGTTAAAVQVSRLQGRVTTPSTVVQVSRLRATASVTSAVQVSRLRATAALATPVQARGGPDLQATPFVPCVLDGTNSTGANITGRWSQISGPALPGFPVDEMFTSFQPPATPTGAVLVFQLSVTDGQQTSVDTVQVTVSRWSDWTLIGTDWVPTAEYVLL